MILQGIVRTNQKEMVSLSLLPESKMGVDLNGNVWYYASSGVYNGLLICFGKEETRVFDIREVPLLEMLKTKVEILPAGTIIQLFL